MTKSKIVYYKDILANSSVKDMYRTVNELLNKDSNPLPDTESPSHLANEFGQFFVDKVQKIRSEVDKLCDNYSDKDSYFCNINDEQSKESSCMYVFDQFIQVSEEDLLKVISKFPNKSCGLDVFPTWLLNQHVSVLSPALVRIVNMSLSSGVFPEDLRRAIVTPVFKKPSLDKNVLKHYRSVANLPFISKLTEKCASSQILAHVDNHNLTKSMQSAYKQLHGTETALARLHNDFQRALDNQKAVILIMLDLSAAFDTVDAEILLQRLGHEFGVLGSAQMWLKTYLENYKSCRVSVAGEFSDNIELKYGLPQGSVIGPLGFVFYTHIVGDILRQHHLNYYIYADDIQIYTVVDPTVPGDSACALFKLTRCVHDIKQWMINIVRALILSRLDYCNLLFNGITQKNLVRLQKTAK